MNTKNYNLLKGFKESKAESENFMAQVRQECDTGTLSDLELAKRNYVTSKLLNTIRAWKDSIQRDKERIVEEKIIRAGFASCCNLTTLSEDQKRVSDVFSSYETNTADPIHY